MSESPKLSLPPLPDIKLPPLPSSPITIPGECGCRKSECCEWCCDALLF